MLLLIVILPLLGFCSGCFLGRFLGFGTCFLTTFFIFISFLLSSFLFYDILINSVLYKITIMPWILSDSFSLYWCFCFDSLTCIMLIVVTLISFLVHLYSIEYMQNDPHLFRFMSYLSLFTFFMLILITSNNFLQLFIGWEGVGLSSYLLINFWFTRIQANKSSIKAMLINRVGDLFLLIGIFSIYYICDSLDFDIVFSISPLLKNYYIQILFFNFYILDIICFFLFLGAMGKSAQILLHSWLPDAMEGPTPVSALIHAATMVTAGVFLIIRCSFLFEFSPNILNFIIIIGSLTAFFAATTGLFQNDIKKVIAYSTCSQLGYMIFACGLSSYNVGLFHLYNHAFFKALLFLSAGSIIHAISDEQDMRKMGGLRFLIPFSYSAMLIGSLALIGFPFLSGFYSKDVILEIAFAKSTNFSFLAYYLGIFGAFCTSFYSTRLLILIFLVKPNGLKNSIFNAHEGSLLLTLPLSILIFFSIFIGFLSKEFFIGFGTNFWYNSIFILPENYIILDIEFINLFYKIFPLLFTLLGSICAMYLYSFGLKNFFYYKSSTYFKIFYYFLNKKWYFDKIFNTIFSSNILFFSYTYCYKDIDRGLLEKLGPWGFTTNIKSTIQNFQKIQTGYIYNYLLTMLFIFYLLFIIYISYSLFKVPLSVVIFSFFLCLIFFDEL